MDLLPEKLDALRETFRQMAGKFADAAAMLALGRLPGPDLLPSLQALRELLIVTAADIGLTGDLDLETLEHAALARIQLANLDSTLSSIASLHRDLTDVPACILSAFRNGCSTAPNETLSAAKALILLIRDREQLPLDRIDSLSQEVSVLFGPRAARAAELGRLTIAASFTSNAGPTDETPNDMDPNDADPSDAHHGNTFPIDPAIREAGQAAADLAEAGLIEPSANTGNANSRNGPANDSGIGSIHDASQTLSRHPEGRGGEPDSAGVSSAINSALAGRGKTGASVLELPGFSG